MGRNTRCMLFFIYVPLSAHSPVYQTFSPQDPHSSDRFGNEGLLVRRSCHPVPLLGARDKSKGGLGRTDRTFSLVEHAGMELWSDLVSGRWMSGVQIPDQWSDTLFNHRRYAG